MKFHFVLDENVIVLAYRQLDDQGRQDATCLELIQEIALRCHSLIVSDRIWHLYARQVELLKSQRVPMTPRVMGVLKSLIVDSRKETLYLGDHELAPIPGLTSAPHVDEGESICFRAAATTSGSVLVTTDRPFRESVESQLLDREHGVLLRSPAEALQMLRDTTQGQRIGS